MPTATPKSRESRNLTATPRPRAVLLYAKDLSAQDRKVAKILDLFGIAWTAMTVAELTSRDFRVDVEDDRTCILSSAPCMAEALNRTSEIDAAPPGWAKQVSSIYIYHFQDTDACRRLLRLLTGDHEATIRRPTAPQAFMSITGDFAEMCGPMSGLQFAANIGSGDAVFDLRQVGEGFQSIIRANESDLFVKVVFKGVRFYLNACLETIDIMSPSSTSFEVKEHFCSAVPTVMYLKWAFSDISWMTAETAGCLIVDDPLIKPRYGFLRFREALQLMDQHNFTTTIAFIPWNWRRTELQTVCMFRERPDRLSLSVHGCDHTANEFAARSTSVLNKRIKTAIQRMERLRHRTSLPHYRVMVFPQGVFSPQTGRALKLNGFVAAVNTEVAPFQESDNATTIADLWDVAIMKYGTLPIFTRRYPTQGVENFAFDALLGKPCLIVAHHDAFKGHTLVEFVAKLNGLQWNLRWRALGDIVSRSVKTVRRSDGTNIVRMYATRILLENQSVEPRQAVLVKEEGDPDCVRAVTVDSRPVDWCYDGRYLQCKAKVTAEGTADVRVVYFDTLDLPSTGDGTGVRIKTAFRRYLSEFRDNYISQSVFLSETVAGMKPLFRRPDT